MNATFAPIDWSRNFALFHARRSVAELMRVLEGATQEYVVLVRNDDLFYVYRRNELAAALKDKDTDSSVEKALDMHEKNRSRPIDPAVPPPPAPRHAEGEATPSVGRYVELGAAGTPVRVGVPAAAGEPGPVRGTSRRRGGVPRSGGATLPPPTRGGEAGGTTPERVEPPSSPPAISVGRGATIEDATTNDIAGIGISTRAEEVTDEGTDVVRHPSITPDRTPKSGEWFSINVDLLRERSDLETVGDEVRISSLPEDWGEIPIQVQLMSTDLQCSPEGGTIYVRRNAPSLACTFNCKLTESIESRGSFEVIATFMHEGRFCGHARRTIRTEQGEISRPEREVTEDAARTSTPSALGKVVIEMGAQSPDLTVKIFHPDMTAAGCYAWSLTPRERFDGLPGKLDGSIQLDSTAQDYARDLFVRLAELTPGDHMAEFEGVGETLWLRAPSCFREAYWAMRDNFGKGFSIQFISDDPYVPWELMRPIREGEAANLLVVDHPVARWIAHYDGELRNKLPSGRIVTIAPQYRSAGDQLPEAQAEAKQLVSGFQAARVDGTRAAVKTFLANGFADEAVAVVHFAGHGAYGAAFADASHIVLEDGNLSVNEVGNASVKLGEKDRTLVIFNACEVGAVGSVLGMVGGWAEAFTRRRFGGFLAPLWPVADEDAATVISELVDAVWTQRKPVGESLRTIRAKYGDRSPTFLSYLFYGDVTAKVAAA